MMLFKTGKNSEFFKKRKKIWILGFLMALLAFFAAIYFFNYHNNKIATEDWAFKNSGQVICNTKGTKGIDINLGNAWRVAEGQKVIVAVVDTGIDPSCIVLKNNLLRDKYNRILGYDFYGNQTDTYSKYLYDYHGTYVATTIARVAPKSKILPVKFMQGVSGSSEDAVKSIQYAIDHNVDIINCSWDMFKNNEELFGIIKANPDVLFVCSAGNSYINVDKQPIYPCCYDLDNIISVMAIDNRGEPFEDTGFGTTVDIGAPGKQVNVILPENDTDFIDGSSVATAFVSGAAALVLSKQPDLAVKEVVHIIKTSAKKIPQLKNKCQTEGILDISEALAYLQAN